MADQTVDPRLEMLLRDVLTAEVTRLPLTVRPDRILERAEARRRTRARSRLRLLVFGDPTSGVRQLSVAMGALAALALAGALAVVTLRVDRTPVAAPLPTTVAAWSRVAIDTGAEGGVESLTATPLGLLARGDGEAGAWMAFSADGRTWTRVPADQIPNLDNPSFGVSGAAVVGDDRRFLMVGREAWASEDGITWSRVATPTDDPELGQGAVIAVASGGPGFVAVGASNKAWYSADGSDWAIADVPPAPDEPADLAERLDGSQTQGNVEMDGVAVSGRNFLAWGKSIWVHVDGSATFEQVLWRSTDGRSWTHQPLPNPAWDLENVTGGPNGFLMAGPSSPMWFSADGTSWELVTAVRHEPAGAAFATFASAIAAGGTGYVSIGGVVDPRDDTCHLFGCPSEEAVVWASPDGRSWTRLPSDGLFGGDGSAEHAGADLVAAWGDRFVIGGSFDARPAVWISE